MRKEQLLNFPMYVTDRFAVVSNSHVHAVRYVGGRWIKMRQSKFHAQDFTFKRKSQSRSNGPNVPDCMDC